MSPRHPGKILADDFMYPSALSARALAASMDVPTTRVTRLLNGTNGMTADTALRLEEYFGIPAARWCDMQRDYDLALAREKRGARSSAG